MYAILTYRDHKHQPLMYVNIAPIIYIYGSYELWYGYPHPLKQPKIKYVVYLQMFWYHRNSFKVQENQTCQSGLNDPFHVKPTKKPGNHEPYQTNAKKLGVWYGEIDLFTVRKTNSLPLKMDGWKRIVSFWLGFGLFSNFSGANCEYGCFQGGEPVSML